MTKVQILSLGAWCRPAYQIGVYTQQHKQLERVRGPFDWTITSFKALKNCLHSDFSVDTVLDPDAMVSSFARSAMCEGSEVIFHHDINAQTLAKFGNFAKGDKITRSDGFEHILDTARGRFLHTFKALDSLRSSQDPILFVRWLRVGHPDTQYPVAFEGETEQTIVAAVEKFLGHDRFHILSVRSEIIGGQTEALPEPVISFQPNGKFIDCTIKERQGWNGDQTYSFKGDENSWRVAFDQTLTYLNDKVF